MRWYYLTEANEVAGPVTEERLRELIDSGSLSQDSQICQEGTEEWIELVGILAIPASTSKASSLSTPTHTRGKWRIIVFTLVITAIIGGAVWFSGGFGSRGKDSSVSPNLVATHDSTTVADVQRRTSNVKQQLWHFEFGSSQSDCIAIMKSLRDEGVFDELDASTVLHGWLPGAKSVEGKTPRGGEVDLDGLLRYPANRLKLYFLDDALVGISASTFLGIIPPGTAERQAQGLEPFFGSEAELHVVEDEVENEMRYYRLQKGSLVASIRDREKGSLEVRISQSAYSKEGKKLGTTSNEEKSRGDEVPISSDATNVAGSSENLEAVLEDPEDLEFDSQGVSPSDTLTNSIGMKFSKVAIPTGPTSEKTILFSVWETRKKDFSAYAESEPTWLSDTRWKTGEGQEGIVWSDDPNSPVTFVNHADASSFCLWLTQKEQREELIPKHAEYRLPTDHEWSCAVGIGKVENPELTAKEKNGAIEGIFPWGREWPPPSDFGHIKIDGTKSRFDKGLAPVGSFRPGMFGLHDMAGNVGELVWDINSPRNIEPSRGSAWLPIVFRESKKDRFLSSSRMIFDREHFTYQEHQGRCNDLGFRCVLEIDGPVSVILRSSLNPENAKSRSSREGPSIKILSASYGVGKKRADVTEKVKQYIEIEKRGFRVAVKALGADPAPRRKKSIQIRYVVDGKTFTPWWGRNELVSPAVLLERAQERMQTRNPDSSSK